MLTQNCMSLPYLFSRRRLKGLTNIKRDCLKFCGFDAEIYWGVTQEGPSRRDDPSALRLLADHNPQHDYDNERESIKMDAAVNRDR